ncbi:MAG: hypothetical protein GY862_27870, partial [Gammaproteobacteria bacterium]|nr:hypothetical protein [Gammaproteobacteria bacterium]
MSAFFGCTSFRLPVQIEALLLLCLMAWQASAAPCFDEQERTRLRINPEWAVKELQAALKDANDVCRVALYIELSDLYRIMGEPVQARKMAKKAVNLAVPSREPTYRASALNVRATIRITDKKYQAALED